MSEDRDFFLIGLFLGAAVIGLWWFGYNTNAARVCASEHNVYECERIYVPVQEAQ